MSVAQETLLNMAVSLVNLYVLPFEISTISYVTPIWVLN